MLLDGDFSACSPDEKTIRQTDAPPSIGVAGVFYRRARRGDPGNGTAECQSQKQTRMGFFKTKTNRNPSIPPLRVHMPAQHFAGYVSRGRRGKSKGKGRARNVS